MFTMSWQEIQQELNYDAHRYCAAGDSNTMCWIYNRLKDSGKKYHVELCRNASPVALNDIPWYKGDII